MKIATISDTHNRHKEIIVPEADIVLHAGDISGRGRHSEIMSFMDWYGKLNCKHKVMIAGNHDWGFEQNPEEYKKMAADNGIILLEDTSVTIEGLKIWGSPIQPAFCNWAFNRARAPMHSTPHCAGHAPIEDHWDKIPMDTDIVLTHGPVYGFLDVTYYGGDHVGCEYLAEVISKVQPLMHVGGHIHEARGTYTVPTDKGFTTFVNASSLNLSYNPHKDKTFLFDLDKLRQGTSRGRDY